MSLRNSNNEKDILFEARLFRTIREPEKLTPVEKVSASRFPNGRLENWQCIILICGKDLISKGILYLIYTFKKFPVKDDISDFLAVQLAAVSLSKGNLINIISTKN